MSDGTQINEWTPGDPCCGGCAIRTIDFTEPGWESLVTSADTITLVAGGVTIAPGTTIAIAINIAASNAPFELAIAAESAVETNVLKLHIEILEDDVIAETVYVEDMTAAELDQEGETYGRRVRLDSNGETYWDTNHTSAADPAAILANKLGVVVAEDQYWAGDWVKSGLSADTRSVDFTIVGDDGGWFPTTETSGPVLIKGSGSMDAIVSSPRTAGSIVKFTLTNDSAVAMKIAQITLARMNSPEQDVDGRETCVIQPISCEATADQMRMRWTDVRITMPDATVFSMMMGNRQCLSGGSTLPLTYDSFDEFEQTLWHYPSASLPGETLEYEFDAIQYGPIEAVGQVQATENPAELLLSATATIHMLSSMMVRGSDGGSTGSDAWMVTLTIGYEKTIAKPAKFETAPDTTLGAEDIVSFSTITPSSSPFDPDRIEYAIDSLHHGTETGTNTGAVPGSGDPIRWQPGTTWDVYDYAGPATGKTIEGTMIAINQAFVDAIEVVFGQHA